ncbi:MAG: serine dehydratase subunit alpha family protein, partial [Muribaculaceae bacterium]|nr:serine dehydratase subunit alpha family protein [Muribaculaceae bacterium]
MDDKRIKEITALVKREVVPAIGCTEPVAVALCVARATEALESEPRKIEVRLSGNVLKNAMGVGIPGTGMIGLPIAIALGAIVGRSEYGLEVLRDVNDDAVALGREMIDRGIINISLAEDAPSILHIEATVYGEGDERADAIISGTHTGFVRVAHGDEILFEADSCEGTASAGEGTV